MVSVGLLLLSAHLVADFPLQSDIMAEEKLESAAVRAAHVTVHFVLLLPVAVLAYDSLAAQVVLVGTVVVTHWLIDMRRWFSPKEGWGMTWVYINDQILHLLSLSLATVLAGSF